MASAITPRVSSARSRTLAVLVPASLGLAFSLAQTRFSDPPRFDGAGYAVLAESLRTGRGYRAIDHPDSPVHSHFPPGYPLALAAAWTLSGGPSFPVAHALSLACSSGAVALFALWLLRRSEPAAAGLLATAVAVNWAWSRQGGAIQSEPLFGLLGMGAILLADHRQSGRGLRDGATLALVLSGCVLTRHVGGMLAIAVVIDWLIRRRVLAALVAAAVLALSLMPWIAWQAWVGRNTQLALFQGTQLPSLLFEQSRFYLGRIPDLLIGPFVEVGTVFRPEWTGPAMFWASVATGVVLAGWLACIRRPAWRLSGLIPVFTLILLLAWPFTEAGRFLVPLVPFLVIGAWSGLLIPSGSGAGRIRVAGILVAASLPYTVHSIATHRADVEASRQSDFDSACRWIGQHSEPPGPILVRQAGEAFWLAGQTRTALAPPAGSDPEAIDRLIDEYRVAFLIVDDERFAGAEPSPLGLYVRDHAGQLRETYRAGSVAIYELGQSGLSSD